MAPPEMGSFWCAGVGTGAAYQPSNRRGLPPLALSPAPSSTESPLGGRSVGPLGAIAPSARRAGLGVRNCAASGGGSALGAYWSASARTSPAQRRDGQPQRIDSQCGSTGPRAYAPTEAAPAELPPVSCFGRPELSLSGRRRVRSVSFAESPTRFTSPGAPRALGSSFASPGRLPSPAADGAEQDPADAVGDPPGARRDQLQTEKDKAAARRQQRALEPDDELTLARKLWWQVSPRISPGRRLCIVIITSRTFKVGVFLAILASSLVLALDSPYAWWALRYPERLAAVQSISVAFFFAVLFTLEVLLRLAAYREHFLIVRIFDGIEVSEPRPLYWNWMDIAVVAFAWLDVGLSLRPVGESNGAGWLLCMRLLRVARPLRSLSFLPAAKTVVETVVASIGSLGEAFKLLGFFILFFAILGAQLFHGDLRHRCVAADGSMPDPEEACVPVGDLLNTFGSFCPAAQLCLPVGESPDNGSRSYDNVAVATVSVFHAVAGAGFSDSMMPLLKGNGTPLVLLYYAAMVIVGGLFVVNIFVSVLERSYEASVEAAKEADEANKFKKEQDEEAAAAQKLELERPSTPSLRQPSTAETTGSAGTEKGSTPKGTRGRLLALRRPSTASKRVQRRRSARALASALTPGPLPPNRIDRAWADGYRLITCRRAISQVAPASPTVQAASSPEVYQAIKKSAENETGNETAEQGKRGKSFKKRAEVFVKSSAFQGVMTLCIVGSAVVAAVSVEPFIGEREREVTDWLDIGFTIVFVSEMAVKIFALTWAGYWSDAFNRFDFVLVVTGVLENVSSPIIKAATSAAGSSDQMVEGLATGLLLLSCSKAFRTVRLVRVAYQLDLRSVKELGSKFPNVVAALAAIVIVLTLVVFVYAVVLMNALGGAWADDEGIPTVRQHYDDIGWSMISVAQITLTADGYFEAHNAISEAPLSNPLLQRLYAVGMFLLFSFIILNGSLILLTLVTAVLVASFNPEEEAEEEADMLAVADLPKTPNSEQQRNTPIPSTEQPEALTRVTLKREVPLTPTADESWRAKTPISGPSAGSGRPGSSLSEVKRAEQQEVSRRNSNREMSRAVDNSKIEEEQQEGSRRSSSRGVNRVMSRGVSRAMDDSEVEEEEKLARMSRDVSQRSIASARSTSQRGKKGRDVKAGWSRTDHLRDAVSNFWAGKFPGSDRFNFEHHAYNEERLGALEEAHELKYQEMREHAPEYNMNHWDILEAEAEFRLADVGGDFKLSHEEAVTIFNKMGLDTRKGDNAKMLDEYMRQVDNEGDQILEFDEFIQIIQMLKQAAIDAERLSASLKPQVGRNKPRANKLKIRRHTLVRDHKRKPLRKDASRLLRCEYWTVHHPIYELVNTVLIAVSVVIMGFEFTEWGEAHAMELEAATITITVFFVLDIFMTAHVKGPLEYLLTPTHVLDLLVVVATVASLIASDARGLSGLRALRVLRIFQLLSEFKQMRLLLECLSASIQGTFTVFFFLGLFMFLFAILGVAIYGGAFTRCVDGENELMYSEALASCQRGECEAVCFKEGGSWFNPAPNFDSTPEGIWALFVITSLENWQEVLYNAVDSRGVLLQPIQRERLGWSWRQDFSAVYFAAFILVNVILMTNLFVGVVCSEFQMSKRKKERLTNLNAEKREWVLVHDLLVQYAPLRLPRQPRKDASALQRWCFEVFYHGAYAPPLPDLRKKGAKVGARQQGQQQGQAESPRRLARKSPAQIDRARERRRVRAAGARRGEAGEGDSGAQRGGATSGGAADEVGKGSTESPTPPARSWSPSWDEEDTRSASFFVSVAVFAVNMLSLACVVAEFQGMGAEYELVLALTQACCSFLLWLNIVAKVIAIGLPLYWSVSPWDRLELVLEIATPVYCGCRIASFYAQVPGLDHRQLRLLGAVRALRFFRLLTVGWFHLVGAMINALLVALPAVANLVVLIFFWVIAFDFIGVSLFQGAIIADSYPDGDGLSDDFNFATLGKGFLVLCVLLRFEGWAALCADLLTCEYTTARPPAWTIYVFFVVYLVTAVYMMLSVFIALLLDTLEQLNATTGNTVDQRALRRLRDRWSELDPAGDEMIDIAQLGALLRSLGEPFVEAADVSTAASLTRLLVELELPVYLPERKQAGAQGKALLPEGAEVTYIEVAHALAKRAVTGGDPSQFTHYELDPALERIVMSRLPKAYPIVRHLSNNRTFTCEVAVARAIAAGAFDPRRSSRSDLVEGSDDGSDDDFFISEGPHDDLDLGVARPARDGSIRQIRIM